jgi:hypothetical protein
MSTLNESLSEMDAGLHEGAALDAAHVGDIHGAFGTIRRDDHSPRHNWRARTSTLLAILGPGLIVMIGDNDAGAFGTYTQAGQNYGTTLLWTLMTCWKRNCVEKNRSRRAVMRVSYSTCQQAGANSSEQTSPEYR